MPSRTAGQSVNDEPLQRCFSVISPNRRQFLVIALWVPLAIIVLGALIDQAYGRTTVLLFETYALVYGIPAYFVFALLQMRGLGGKTEQQLLKRVWLGPLVLSPFYLFAWVPYGLVQMIGGASDGVATMFIGLNFLPFLLIAGYVVAGLTVALYRTVFS
ncbi:hypothetical protein AM274_12735 [Pseudomonas nunensis]|nr:hypothetical protein AM274_12735 [Pseudomonas nunensis]